MKNRPAPVISAFLEVGLFVFLETLLIGDFWKFVSRTQELNNEAID